MNLQEPGRDMRRVPPVQKNHRLALRVGYILSGCFLFHPCIKPVTLLDQTVLLLFLPSPNQRRGFSRDFGCDTRAQLLGSNCLIKMKSRRFGLKL